MDEHKEFLLREHEELIQLYMHEDKLAWNLVNYYIIINIGILAGIGALFNPQSLIETLISVALCFAGSASGLIWFLFLIRSRMHSDSRMYRAIEIENMLTGNPKVKFDTLKSCEERINSEKKILKGSEGQTRNLQWYEQIRALRSFKYLIIVVSAIWFMVGCFLFSLWIWQSIFPFIC